MELPLATSTSISDELVPALDPDEDADAPPYDEGVAYTVM